MIRVEVIRGPEVNAQPMITVQRREDEDTFAMSVQAARRWMEKEEKVLPPDCPGEENCLYCQISNAVEGLA